MRLNNTNRHRVAATAFTLVELLVVIAIIGILAALLLAAVGPAVDAARRAQINTEMEQFNTALEDYKNSVGSYPPNAQTDDTSTGPESPSTPIDDARVLSDFRRHFLKAFPQSREPDELLEALVGLSPTANGAAVSGNTASNLPGGMNAAESLVFWLGGFSDDPKYPITGPGGPSYAIPTGGVAENQADPIENRSWLLGIEITQLGPRTDDGFYPTAGDYQRYVRYIDPRDGTTTRRINFWVLKAPKLEAPYLYFDASRGSGVTGANDPPAVTDLGIYTGSGVLEEQFDALPVVYAAKTRSSNAAAANPFLFANDGKFQILHPGTDDTWAPMPHVDPDDKTLLLDGEALYPTGPWGPDLTDTLTNFSDGRLGDAQE